MLRVGAVNYLNTKPLIEGLTEFAPNIRLSLDLPSRLADQMAAGELDVGLIPVVEFLRAKNYSLVPNCSISSRGPVLSVTLFSRVPWGEIHSVSLDEGSRTSAALTKVLLANPSIHYHPLPITAAAEDVPTDAVLLIGDRAMKACLPGFEFSYDLGAEWFDRTGLPMVFAVWAVRPGVDLGEAEHAFVRAKKFGLSRAGVLAEREAKTLGLDPGYCRRYFDTIIRYDLGEPELAGLRRYHQLTAELGLTPEGVDLVRYHRPHLEQSR
ncbi:MAG: menaquinone biosynthesis protein [Fimbriiglobus sp.]|jgi:chorismate dehydratase|nr:menaquinone biosynthesis protein [Fimbriiglobus sp.]